MTDIEHNFGFLNKHNVEIYDESWIQSVRDARGEVVPLCAELAETADDLRVNQPIIVNQTHLMRIRFLPGTEELGCAIVPTKRRNLLAVEPKGFEQFYAAELLLDNSVQCVTIYGIPGSGKTFLAMAAAIKLMHEGHFDGGLYLFKPMVTVGKDPGALPGDAKAKLDPFMASFMQHVDKITGQVVGQDTLDKIVSDSGVAYQRGMSYENSIIIIDEAQNMKRHEMLTMLTRLHESSRIFICGDLTQVDDKRKMKKSNGLSLVINHLREADDEDIADLEFFKSERKGVSLKAYKRLTHLVNED